MCTRPRRPSSPIPRLRRRGYFVYIPEIGRITSTNDVYFDERSFTLLGDVMSNVKLRGGSRASKTSPGLRRHRRRQPFPARRRPSSSMHSSPPTPTQSSSLDAAMGRGSSATSSSARLPTPQPLCTTVLTLWGRCWRSVRRSDPCPSRGTPRTPSNIPSTASRG